MRFIIMVVIVVAVAGLGAIAFRPRIARAAMLSVGATAPDFHSQVVNGDQVTPVSLADYHGHKLVLYFYPKDNTPGCTKEACAFRDGYARFQAAGIWVLGCSIDSADSHKAFIKKYGLPFPLLLDPDRSIARAYGADNGVPILGLDRRVTYVIGEDGHILKVYPSVDPGVHAKQIIHDLGADHPPSPTPAASPAASAEEPSGAKGGKGGEQVPRKTGTPQPGEGSDIE
jgi:thioredoxin-dependent peroxiredoxin